MYASFIQNVSTFLNIFFLSSAMIATNGNVVSKTACVDIKCIKSMCWFHASGGGQHHHKNVKICIGDQNTNIFPIKVVLSSIIILYSKSNIVPFDYG